MPFSIAPTKGRSASQEDLPLRHAAKLTTFGTVTQSLLKRFCETGPSINAPSISIEGFPAFTANPLPANIVPMKRNKIILQMKIVLVGSR
jgi:hypothetical protein